MFKKNKKNKKTKNENRRRVHNGGFISKLVTEYNFRILAYVIILVIFGLVMVLSAGYYSTVNLNNPTPFYFLKRHGAYVITGFIWMFLLAEYDYHNYKKFSLWAVIVSIISLSLVFTPLGITVNFATRWIGYGSFRITPSEFSKLFMIVFTSAFIAENPAKIRSFTQGVLPILSVAFIHFGLIVKQPNLSTAIVIVAIMVGIMFVAGLNPWYFVAGGALGAAGTAFILLKLPDSHWYSRLTNWIDPFKDFHGAGYQLSQSVLAVGTGGLFGKGLGRSVAKNLYLPEPQNDFILAIIAEELGFVGVAILLIIYLLLIYEGFKVAAGAGDKFGMYMASGITIMLALQVIINVAVVTASMPTTGITLPFISYGGTSIWVFMMSMGILLNISRKKGIKRV